MSLKAKSGVAAAMLAALVLLEHFGLERTAEKAEEDKYTKVAKMPATSVLPSYIASLFLGSFRAIVVDGLWIELRRMREEEHRYFETVEIMDFIAVLQPRNPEVWVVQAHDAGYNIANTIQDPAKRWFWIKKSFQILDKGGRQLPDNPYIKHNIAETLMRKPTINEGVFDEWFLQKVEEDEELQTLLNGGTKPERPKSAFEWADVWLQKAHDDLMKTKEREGFRYYSSHTGYRLNLSTVDGYRRIAMAHQAHYLWAKRRPPMPGPYRIAPPAPEVAAAFRRAAAQAGAVYREHGLPIYQDYQALDLALAEAAELAMSTNDLVPLVRKLDGTLRRMRRIDFEYCRTIAGLYKQAWGEDRHEWNDNLEYSTPLPPYRPIEASLAGDADEDIYSAFIPQATPGLKIHISVANAGPVEIRFAWLSDPRALIPDSAWTVVRPGEERVTSHDIPREGYSFIIVQAGVPARLDGTSRYRIVWSDRE